MTTPKRASTPKKNRAAATTMMPTITEVIQVSFQLVQVTLRASARTSRRNWAGLTRFFGGASAPAPRGRNVVGITPWSLAMNLAATFSSDRGAAGPAAAVGFI